MKKFLSLILALAMVACMSVTAFAAEGTTTLTVEVPDNTPSYTFHCPASVTLEYGNTNKQEVGDVYVTDVKNCKIIPVDFSYTELININDPSDTIPLTLYLWVPSAPSTDDVRLNYDGTDEEGYYINANIYYNSPDAEQYGFDSNGYCSVGLKAQVSDWSGATAGATYKATITYVVYTE